MFNMPENWFWIVGDDESHYWSSASASYVETLPEDAGFTRIASEQELTDVLATYGMTGPLPSFPPLAPWQFRAMLDIGGIAQAVDNAIAAIADPVQKAVAKARLDYSLQYHRNDPLISMLAPTVNLTGEQIDALWSQAAQLQA